MPAAAEEESWKYTTLDRGEYVTFEQIKSVYHFTSLKKVDSKITLNNQRVKMEFAQDSIECRMNGLLFILLKPVVVREGEVLLSREDLSGIVEPVVRPELSGAGKFRTVVLEAPGGGDEGAADGGEIAGEIADLVAKNLDANGFNVVRRIFGDPEAPAVLGEEGIYLRIAVSPNLAEPSGLATTVRVDKGASMVLATSVHGTVSLPMVRKYGVSFDAGIRRDPAWDVPNAAMPSILIELGSPQPDGETGIIEDPAYQKTVADGIIKGITRYRIATGWKKNPEIPPAPPPLEFDQTANVGE